MKVRPSQDIVVCIDINATELRNLAEKFEKNDFFDGHTFSLHGTLRPKEGVEVRFINTEWKP